MKFKRFDIRLLAVLALFGYLFAGCDEKCAVIPPLQPPTPGAQKVLIEEFTGVRCVQCPAGSAEIESLKQLYGDNLVAVSIHAGFFSVPYPDSKYDFRTTEGNDLIQYLGQPQGYPSAVIMRKQFPGANGLQLGQGQWGGIIQQESQESPKVSITILDAYDPLTRELSATVTIIPTEDVNGSYNISVMMVESYIVDYQLVPGNANPKPDYAHKHVLRGMLTKFDGDPIGKALKKNDIITRNYKYSVPATWNPANCALIAFVNRGDGTSQEVLQVEEKKFTE